VGKKAPPGTGTVPDPTTPGRKEKKKFFKIF
jgi:hypothetical protein